MLALFTLMSPKQPTKPLHMTIPFKHTNPTSSNKVNTTKEDPPQTSSITYSAQTMSARHNKRLYACVLSWIAVVVIAVFIFLMSAKTAQTLDTDSGIISVVKPILASWAAALFGHEVDVSPVGHFCEFFILGVALCNALRFNISLNRAFIAATIFASVYGISDELYKFFVVNGLCDTVDWLV